MTIDARILDLLIQWEEEASAGRAVDLQQLAGGDPQLARRLQRHIDRLGKVAWLGREVDGDSQIELPQLETLQTGMLLPDGVQLASLRENLEKSEILSPEVLAAAFETPHAANAYRLSAYLLDSELLTRFQLRAIAHGTTRGLILGRYMILDKLGEGGMGQVYRARHRRMDRIVALKVLPRDLMSQPHAIDRFNQEMQVAAQLHHRNIVRAYDADEAEGLHFFVMEYVAGSDLQSVVRSEGPLAPSQAIDCVLQAASGLEYAHGVGLVHRDIKPANLLLDGDGTVKILDMGIARLRQPNAEKASLTQEGMVMGTADAAPDRPWIDTLSLVKFPDHAITGSWGRNGDSVIGLRTMNSRLMVPYALNGSYELEMEFTRLEGDDALGVHLPINESSCALVMSGFHGGPLGSGLRMVDGQELRDYPASSNAFAQGVTIVNGHRYQLALRVDVGASSDVAISARLKDQEILDWHGTSDQLSNSPQWALPMECALALLMYDSSYEIHSLRVRPLEGGQGVSLADDWGTPFFPVADRPSDEIANQCTTWNGRAYFLSPNRMNLIESQKLARRLQGRLLTISSPEESAAIAKIAAQKPIWTAGWRPSGNDPWRDERNRPLRFLPDWQANQPDNWYGRDAFLVVEKPGTNSNKGATPLANDVMPHLKWLYPVIEWGEEYPVP